MDLLKKEGKKIYDSLIDYLKSANRIEVADEFIIMELDMYYKIWYDAA